MNKKTWFTVIEILFVIVLMGILLFSARWLLKPKNREIIYWQICSNNIQWVLNNFLNSSLTSKGLAQNGNIIFPDKYQIIFNTPENKISLNYEIANNTYIWQTLDLKNNMPSNFYCNSNEYYTQITWDSLQVDMIKWLSTTNEKPPFIIKQNTQNLFTWAIQLLLCYTNNSNICKIISIYQIDSRTKKINSKICLSYDENNQCIQRNK